MNSPPAAQTMNRPAPQTGRLQIGFVLAWMVASVIQTLLEGPQTFSPGPLGAVIVGLLIGGLRLGLLVCVTTRVYSVPQSRNSIVLGMLIALLDLGAVKISLVILRGVGETFTFPDGLGIGLAIAVFGLSIIPAGVIVHTFIAGQQ